MKLKFCLLGLIGIGEALSLSDELKALVNFDQWAQTSIENHNFSGKTPAVSSYIIIYFHVLFWSHDLTEGST